MLPLFKLPQMSLSYVSQNSKKISGWAMIAVHLEPRFGAMAFVLSHSLIPKPVPIFGRHILENGIPAYKNGEKSIECSIYS